MTVNGKEDLRHVGYGVLGGAIVFLVYDVMQKIIENGLTDDVRIKFVSFLIAIIIGTIFIKLIPKITRIKDLHFLIVALVILVICVIVVFWLIFTVSAFTPITIKTESSNYEGSEIITVSGKVSAVFPNEKVLIKIFYPNGELYNSAKVSLIEDSNIYQYNFNIKPLNYNMTDIFTINATYSGATNSAKQVFAP